MHSVHYTNYTVVPQHMNNAIVPPTSIMLKSCMMQTNKSRLQKLQTRAAQLISDTGPRDSRNPVFKELGWLSLENRKCMHKCTMVFKCRNGLAPQYLIDSFNGNTFNHS